MTHTLVLDVGKTNAKLVLINEAGEVLARHVQENHSVNGPGYLALGTEAIGAWILDTLPRLPDRQNIGDVNVTTHGAAFCAVDDRGLVFPPIDYEWDGYGDVREAFKRTADGFAATGSPDLPLGLNAGLQLYWLQKTQPSAWQRVRYWMPYPQYWAWWFSGQVSSEVSSLGCHTHLWSPTASDFAPWARQSGIAKLFAPLRQAWEVLGPVKQELTAAVGLPKSCRVHVGVHDSNACLARHLHSVPNGTVVSTGTWCVVMAPGGTGENLDPTRDQLLNVSVDGRPVPTTRFMGGREFAVLCAGADPSLSTLAALDEVLVQGWSVTPSFAESGGPYQGRMGKVWRQGTEVSGGIPSVPLHLRPALAAMYCAQMTAHLVESIAPVAASRTAVVVEGPLASNIVYNTCLNVFLGQRELLRSKDELEGTARGAWMLADWSARAGLSSWYEPLTASELMIPTRHLQSPLMNLVSL